MPTRSMAALYLALDICMYAKSGLATVTKTNCSMEFIRINTIFLLNTKIE